MGNAYSRWSAEHKPLLTLRAFPHIPPPKISSIDQYPAQRGQITSPCRRSLSTHIAEGDSAAKAKAGTNGVVPRPSDEHPVIQKLKEALRIRPDQTTVLVSPVDLTFSWDLNTGQTLDDVDLDSLPEVEHFLESSWVR